MGKPVEAPAPRHHSHLSGAGSDAKLEEVMAKESQVKANTLNTSQLLGHSEPAFNDEEAATHGVITLDGTAKLRATIDPQQAKPRLSRYPIWVLSFLSIVCGVWYLYWRFTSTKLPEGALQWEGISFSAIYWWAFFVSECAILVSVTLSSLLRFFPVHRVVCTMDELVAADPGLASKARVAVVVPTAGEKLSVALKVLLGATSQRIWEASSALPVSKRVRVVVMDETHRTEVYQICEGLYAIAKLLRTRELRRILLVEGVGLSADPESPMDFSTASGPPKSVLTPPSTPLQNNAKRQNVAPVTQSPMDMPSVPAAAGKGKRGEVLAEQWRQLTPMAFYKWVHLGGGFNRQHLYDCEALRTAVETVRAIDELVLGKEGKLAIYDKLEQVYRVKTPMPVGSKALLLPLPDTEDGRIPPGFTEVFDDEESVPALVYHSRNDPGMPAASPKAGNLNCALFPAVAGEARLIGDATLLAVNDCRHQLGPMFLQRTVPYLFRLSPGGSVSTEAAAPTASVPTASGGGGYEWADRAFVQTPQRFPKLAAMRDDPLGNRSLSQYSISFVGKDGVGATPSAGHGCVWRVSALLGREPDGQATRKNPNPEMLSVGDAIVGKSAGFRSQVLIEDTHTSMELFQRGWRSVYINQEGEVLSSCVQQPDSLTWRLRQLLRWHQGAVELLLLNGISFPLLGRWPTMWHRLYAYEILTYYLYAFPGYAILWMPVVFGLSGIPPFACSLLEVAYHLVPFLLATQAPTVIARRWHKVDSLSLIRDETVWLSTLHVMIYAVLSVLWSSVCSLFCGSGGRAWVQSAPAWPLFATFAALITALAGTTFQLSFQGYQQYGVTFICSLVPIIYALYALWPQVDMQLPHGLPAHFMLKFVVLGFVGVVLIAVST